MEDPVPVQATGPPPPVKGGRFDFDDGGTYCGGWEDGRAHGHGVCTGPKAQGEYSGSWHYGFEVSGIYTWPSGACYEGQWQNGKRHGLGIETRGRWVYKGEWTQGYKGRYGVRQSLTSNAKYEGTWVQGLQDGYGSETYGDGGTYQGQWHRGMRQGYGVRASAPYGMATHSKPKGSSASLANRHSVSSLHGSAKDSTASQEGRGEEGRGGFVLKAKSDEPPKRRGSVSEKPVVLRPRNLIRKLRKQKSTGDLDKRTTTASVRSNDSTASWVTSDSGAVTEGGQDESNASFVTQDEQVDPNVTETYMGEWKNDKRTGFGVTERSDGLKYEGEWYNNKKYGYGVTTFRDGTKEEGKYKNNVLITSEKKKHLFLIRSAKFRERIEQAVSAANRAYKIALQKADIAISRTANARGKAEQAELAAIHARDDADMARKVAKELAPDFRSAGETLATLTRLVQQTVPTMQSSRLKELSPIPHLPQFTYSKPSVERDVHLPPDMNAHTDLQAAQSFRSNGTALPTQQPVNTPTDASFNRPDRFQEASRAYQTPYGNTSQPPGPGESLQQNHLPILAASAAPLQTASATAEPYYPPAPPYGNDPFQAGMGSHGPDFRRPSYFHQPPDYSPQIRPYAGPTASPLSDGPVRQQQQSAAMAPHTATSSQNYNISMAMNDHFDQYRRSSSRDRSVDRYSSGGRYSSRTNLAKGQSPMNRMSARDERGRTPGSRPQTPISPISDFSPLSSTIPSLESLPSSSSTTPKRTESLYITPVVKQAVPSSSTSTPRKRKKSLPDEQQLPKTPLQMTREEVAILSHNRRQEVRRQIEDAERYRANPLLYLTSPQVQEWCSRQQLVILVFVINIILAAMFFKLLT